MSVISEMYADSPCEIKTMSNELLTDAIVKDVDGDCIVIAGHSDILPLIHCGTQVKMNIFNNVLGFAALVGQVFLSSAELMKITDVQTLIDFERRQFFRIKISAAAKICLLNAGGEPMKNEKLFSVGIMDISLSGCLIRTKRLLDIGQELMLYMNLMTETSVAFDSVIQREQPIKEDVNGYGCMFLNCSNLQTDLLCNYIFKKQREQIACMKKAQFYRSDSPLK